MSTITPSNARGPLFQPAYYRPWLRFIDSTDSADGGAGGEQQGDEGKQEQTLTQADVDRIVKDRVARVQAKFADYDDLKARAGEKATADERIAELEKKYADAESARLRSDVAAQYGISAEDRDLFLTGTDSDTLTAQAKRLTERESDRKKQGNVARNEGKSTLPKIDEERQTVRELFGSGQ